MPTVAIVTGASAGLGRALACELGHQGYAVGVIARRKAPLRLLVDELKSEGVDAALAIADVGDRTAMHAAIGRLTAALGPVELVIANAGIGLPDQLDPFDADVVEQTFAINFFGVINTIAAVLPQFESGQGHIVGISSLGADRGLPGSAAYTASKSAVSTYLEGLRVSLRPRGIAVTTVCPGFVRTDMTAGNQFRMPGLMTPEVAARRIVRALRHRPAEIRFPFTTSLLMRSIRLLPDWAVERLIPR